VSDLSPHSYTVILDLLNEVADFLEDYADADGGPDGYRPNKAMSLGLRVEEEIARLVAAPSSSGPSRDGWKLVPTEATAEMVQAAEDRHVEGASYIAEGSIQFALWREVWRAMLAASPRATEDKGETP
jgi:hypothetical protein